MTYTFYNQIRQYAVFQMAANAYSIYDDIFEGQSFSKIHENPFMTAVSYIGDNADVFISSIEEFEYFLSINSKLEEKNTFLIDNKPITDDIINYSKEILNNIGRAISFDKGESWYRIDGIRLWRGGMFVCANIKESGRLGNITSIRAVASYEHNFLLRDHILDDKTNEDYIEEYVPFGTNILKQK